MIVIGRSNAGGYMVELTIPEYNALMRLAVAIEGNKFYYGEYNEMVNVDLDAPLGVIYTYSRHLEMIKKLEREIGVVRSIIEGK